MRKKRWKKILIWAASIIVVLGVGGLFAANYIVDKLIASLADSLENERLEETLTETADTPDVQADDTDTNTTNEPTEETNAEADASEGNAGSSNIPSSNTDDVQEDSNGEADTGETSEGYTAEVSTDKAKDVQEKITVSEKAQLTSVFLKELSMEDIKALQGLASGGLNLEEKKEARDLILEKLSPEQYDELIQIAKKYGMSQGKSYAEVAKEE